MLIATVTLLALALSGCLLGKKPGVTSPTQSTGSGNATIKGVVRNTDGQPLSDVKVTIQGTSLQTTTGVGGSFEFSGAPAGQITVEFAKSQYLLTVKNIQAAGSQAVVANVTLSPLDASLHNGLLAANGYTGKCGSCHKLHTTTEVTNPALLTASTVNGACFSCHDGANRGPSQAVYDATAHSPAQPANSSTVQVWSGMGPSERGNCTTCHEPHGTSGTKVMLRAGSSNNTNGLCQSCHTADGTNNTKRWPGWAGYAKTSNLHYNPPLPGNGTLRTYPGTSYAAGECLNCHVPHGKTDSGSVTPAMTRDKEEKLCMKCHTGFASRIQAGTTVRHKCSLCHNPHVVENANRYLIAKGTDKTQETTDSKKDNYRYKTQLADSYCLGCHYSGNPYGAPLYQNSNFKDGRYASSNSYYDLHRVHLAGPDGGSGETGYHGSYEAGLNRLRCSDCHDVHPTAGPSRPSGMSSKMLRTDRITTITYTSGKYNGRAGCSTGYPCHYNSASNSYFSASCDWCHANTTQAGKGSPGWACTYHGTSVHAAVYLP